MSDGPEEWFVILGGRGKGGPLSLNAPPSVTSEPVSAGGAASSAGPSPPRVGAGGRVSLDCLSASRQPSNLRYSPIESTDISYIDRTVSMWWTRGRKRITHHHESWRRGFRVVRPYHKLSDFVGHEVTALRLE